jgi:3-deoxy-D-manno-octulosonic-acid transferase
MYQETGLLVKIAYNLIIVPALYCSLKIISAFHKKLRRSVEARKGIIEKLNRERISLNPYSITILFHCSSMGEYKQIVPIAEKLAADQKEDYNLVLSLYSPSAYENIDRKKSCFKIVTYTPFDFYFETRKFINTINPDIVLISKHDIWPNFIWELKKREVPVFLINGLFADDTKMDRWYAKSFYRSVFSGISGIFTINEKHRQRFLKIFPYPDRIEASGDTRYDSALTESDDRDILHPFDQLESRERVFIAGSSWPTGERFIIKAWKDIKDNFTDAFLIIVPHEIGVDHIYKIESQCQELKLKTLVLTEMNGEEKLDQFDVLIVDKIGILAKIYRFGSIAYVGGGFSKNGLHSVIEPAVYGLPVVFGPNLDKSPEAQEMNLLNCGIIFNNDGELVNIVNSLWSDNVLYRRVSEISYEYIRDKSGSSEKIIKVIKEKTSKPKIDKRNSVTEEEFERMMNEENSGKI